MITKEDLGPFMFNEKVEQLLKERDEALAKLAQNKIYIEKLHRTMAGK